MSGRHTAAACPFFEMLVVVASRRFHRVAKPDDLVKRSRWRPDVSERGSAGAGGSRPESRRASGLGCDRSGRVEECIRGGVSPGKRFEVQLTGAGQDRSRAVEVAGFQRGDALEQLALLTAMSDQRL